jgi:hypothetical protein
MRNGKEWSMNMARSFQMGTSWRETLIRGGALAGIAAPAAALAIASPMGRLVGQLHMSLADAVAVLTLVQGVGAAAAIAAFPLIAPFVGTLELLLFVSGTGAVIGF